MSTKEKRKVKVAGTRVANFQQLFEAKYVGNFVSAFDLDRIQEADVFGC